MRVALIKSGDFCAVCGKETNKVYRINFGTYSSEIDLCEKCMAKLYKQMGKAIDKEGKEKKDGNR